MSSTRPQEITSASAKLIDEQLTDLEHGRATEMLEIEAFADKLFIHHTHLSNTIKETTAHTPCSIYQEKILDIARRLLGNPA